VLGGAAKTWKRDAVPASVIGGEAVQLASNWVVADSLLNCWTAASCMRRWPPKCGSRRASWRNGCKEPGQGRDADSRKQLADLLAAYLAASSCAACRRCRRARRSDPVVRPWRTKIMPQFGAHPAVRILHQLKLH
jgi:hypothetical protein